MTEDEKVELLEDASTNIRVAAAQKARRYGKVMPYADLYQEGVCWVLQHPGTTRQRLDDGRRGSTRLTGQIAKALEKLCRAEKAYGQYDPADEAFYTRTMIEAVLPALWDEHYATAPPEQKGEYVRQHNDPSEQGSWLAMVIDVRRAWTDAILDPNWRTALVLRYSEGLRVYQIGKIMEVADSTVSGYLDKGIRSLIRTLGGPKPGDCPPDCECREIVGTRRVISNAQAAAITEHAYDQE